MVLFLWCGPYCEIRWKLVAQGSDANFRSAAARFCGSCVREQSRPRAAQQGVRGDVQTALNRKLSLTTASFLLTCEAYLCRGQWLSDRGQSAWLSCPTSFIEH